MKKFALGLTACVLSVALLGCSASQGMLGQSLDSKMNDLQDTINSIKTISSADIALDNSGTDANKTDVKETAVNGFQNPYGNVNTYGYPLFNFYGGYGMYPGFNPYGYGFQGVNNMAGYKNFYMPYGQMPYGMYGYGSNNAGRWASNIDTYRINSTIQNGETTTTVDSYHNGEHTGQTQYTEPTESQESTQQGNLETTCQICLISNAFGDDLKNEILTNIDYVKDLSNSIKNFELELSKNQIKSVNELLDNITTNQSKINMTKGEVHKNVQNVMAHKDNAESQPNTVNAKYIKLLSSMDTRNTHLKNILASLIEMENCIDGNCGFNFNQNLKNSNWIKACPNGECTNCTNCTTCEVCQNCQSCTTSSGCSGCTNCTNCLLCTDCQGCNNCFNCTDCINCTNIANATGWVNNKPCANCNDTTHKHTQQSTNPTTTVEQNEDNQNSAVDTENNQTITDQNGITTSLPQTPSTGSVRVPNNIEGEIKPNVQETSINADNVVEDNLLEEGEFLAEDNASQHNNIHNPMENNDTNFTTENGESVEPKTLEEDSIFNENENENNKALTA